MVLTHWLSRSVDWLVRNIWVCVQSTNFPILKTLKTPIKNPKKSLSQKSRHLLYKIPEILKRIGSNENIFEKIDWETRKSGISASGDFCVGAICNLGGKYKNGKWTIYFWNFRLSDFFKYCRQISSGGFFGVHFHSIRSKKLGCKFLGTFLFSRPHL